MTGAVRDDVVEGGVRRHIDGVVDASGYPAPLLRALELSRTSASGPTDVTVSDAGGACLFWRKKSKAEIPIEDAIDPIWIRLWVFQIVALMDWFHRRSNTMSFIVPPSAIFRGHLAKSLVERHSTRLTITTAVLETFASVSSKLVSWDDDEYGAYSDWSAPEQLLGSGTSTGFTDLWKLGCLLYEFHGRGAPFGDGSPGDRSSFALLIRQFSTLGTPTPDTWPGVEDLPGYSSRLPHWEGKRMQSVTVPDQCALDLIQKLLVITPTKRLTVGAVLAHSYFDVLRQTRDGSTNICNDAKLTNMVIMTRLRASFKRQYRNLGRARWRREKQAKKLAKNRRLLLSWLIDLAEDVKLGCTPMFTCAYLFDSLGDDKRSSDPQLDGETCLLLSTKLSSHSPPLTIADLSSYACDRLTCQDIQQREVAIINSCRCHFPYVTPLNYLRYFHAITSTTCSVSRDLSLYFLQLSMVDGPDPFGDDPELIALAIMCTIRQLSQLPSDSMSDVLDPYIKEYEDCSPGRLTGSSAMIVKDQSVAVCISHLLKLHELAHSDSGRYDLYAVKARFPNVSREIATPRSAMPMYAILAEVDPLAQLPTALMVEICRMLSPVDLAKTSLVSQSWKDLSFKASLWKHVDIGGIHNHFMKTVNNSGQFGVLAAHRCPLLEYLCLSETAVSVPCLSAVLKSCPRVHTLILEKCTFVDGAGELPEFNPHTAMRRLDLRRLRTNSSVIVLALLRACSRLFHLDLSSTEYDLSDAVLVARANVKSIDLTACTWVNDDLVSRISGLRSCYLDMCRYVSDLGIIPLVTASESLLELELCYMPRLTDRSLLALSRSCLQLQTLELSFGNFSDEAIATIASLSQLRKLALCRISSITDSSVTRIAQGCTLLQDLNLRMCEGVTSVSLFAILGHCHRLQQLHVFTCPDELADKFRQRNVIVVTRKYYEYQ
ncbi:unnamed protein product (mitochondrion) [Plasmodiophora brassicae]|uniref:F-box domain-containing protein n=1 Tax=Plasmodiophora brassicae TaxID=37360 RepID=A0A3P3Y3L9_PLABS|nr:unnamed protein product [Plasmodiophora brassicae]